MALRSLVSGSNFVHRTNCCGLYELHGVRLCGSPDRLDYCPPGKIVVDLAGAFVAHNKKPLVVFTDTVKNAGGQVFADYIVKHKLGTVVKSQTRRNPNSRNMINGWIWSVDYKAVEEYCKKRKNRS